MSSLLAIKDETFEEYTIDKSISEIRDLIENLHPDMKKAHDFYNTMHNCLIALEYSMQENRVMRRSYDNLLGRVKIMEKLLASYAAAAI